MSGWDRAKVLEGLASIAPLGTKAEALDPALFLRMTLPVRAHLSALDPDILLIIGGRGAGKTHLFRIIHLTDGPRILGYSGRASNAIWIVGFFAQPFLQVSLHLPGENVLQRFAAEHKERTELLEFWLGLLLGAVLAQEKAMPYPILREALPSELQNALRDLSNVEKWWRIVEQSSAEIDSALYRLDDELVNANRFLIVTYDDLDVMAVEWKEKRALLQALFQFWLGRWRRWRRIRPKIFLRRDLFSPEFLQFPDASKLEGHKYELRWTPNLLYQLVFKLWANQNDASRAFLTESGLSFIENEHLGWYYSDEKSVTEEVLREVVHRLVGKYMGRGPKKGRSFEWIPNHLQDARGEIVPRSMIALFSEAAKYALERQEETSETLMSPSSFAASIVKASEQRITELLEEYPWLETVRKALQGQHVPMLREQLATLLKQIDWNEAPFAPPSTSADDLIEYMMKIGVLYLTYDKRVHVPDIYLYGFGLKRKGGIRRSPV